MLTTWNPVFPKGFCDFMRACGALRTEANTHTFTANVSKLIDLAGVRTIFSLQPLLDECAADAHGSSHSAIKQINYSDNLVLNDVELFRDAKAMTIFCRAKATPLKPIGYAFCFDIKDGDGNLIGSIEPQPIWDGLPGQTVICSGPSPSSIRDCQFSIRVTGQSGYPVIPPTLASSGTIRPDGSLLLGNSKNGELINEVANDRFKILSTCKNIVAYENRSALEKCFFVNQIKWSKHSEEALEYLKAHPNEIASTVVLENDQMKQFQALFKYMRLKQDYSPSFKFSQDGLIQFQESPRQLTKESALDLQVTVPSLALLVVSDLYYPGWNAFLDGQTWPIFRADSLLRAVLIPTGEHHIRFAYQPISFVIGLILFAVTITMLLCFLARHVHRYFRRSD